MVAYPRGLNNWTFNLWIEYFPFGQKSKVRTTTCRISHDDRSCPLTKLQEHTLYTLKLKYEQVLSTTFMETWPQAPQKVHNLKLKLDCDPLNPCISATWVSNDSQNTDFNVMYYPINVKTQSDVQRLSHSFNISKNTFISHPTTHVMGSTVEFVVRGVTEFQMSEAVYSTIALPEGVPSDFPRNLQVRNNQLETFIAVTWDPPKWETINGQLHQTEIFCTLQDEHTKVFTQNTTSKEIQISKMFLKEEANCQLRFWTGIGPGPWSPMKPISYVYTDVEPPTDINAIRVSECCLKVTWRWRPEFMSSYSAFSIKSYTVDDNDTEVITKTTYPFSLVYLDHLVARKRYIVQVRSLLKDARQSPWSPVVTPVPFMEAWPTCSIHYPKCSVSTYREVTLRWMFPYNVNNLLHFRINFTGVTNYQAADGRQMSLLRSEMENSLLFDTKVEEYVTTIGNLLPNTEYSFDIDPIFCCAAAVWTSRTRTTCRTLSEAPEIIPEPKIMKIDTDNLYIHLLLDPPSNEYGPVNILYLVVVPKDLLSENAGSTGIPVTDVSSRTWDLIETTLLTKDNPSGLSDQSSQYLIFEINATSLMNRSPFGRGFTFPLGYQETDSKLLPQNTLASGEDYRAAFVACITSDLTKETMKRLCSASSWSEIINAQHSHLFQLHKTGNKYSKHNETDTDNAILVGVVLTSVFVPLGLCLTIIFTRLLIKRRNDSFQLLHTCLKLRTSSQDYYPASGNEMKENLVNPLILTTHVGSSYSTHNPDSLELKRYHISSTPDLLAQSSSSLNFKKTDRFHSSNNHCALSQHKVPIALLHEYISNLKANDNRGFAREFESIDHAHEYTWEHSNKSCNKAKNRYANVVAYDHSRVVLQTYPAGSEDLDDTEDAATDYINANYINGYRKQNAYIATQGPLPETISDFWRMVWEQRTSVVVMLTLLVERCRTKCEQYWPKGNKGAQCTFGGIVVTLNDVHELAYYVSRLFMIHKKGSTEKREIKHFQFTAWPDHGVPQATTPFLMFVNRIKNEVSLDSGPIIVHCSAGVGRTGDFIAVDSMLEQVKHEKYLDIYSYVTHIRSQRNYMVQTEEQYIFIHNVLLDYLQSVNTEVTKQQLFTYVEKLSKIEIEKSGFIQVSGFQLEYRRLLGWSSCFSHIIPSTKSECSTKSSDSITGQLELSTVNYETALAIINQSKNRNPRCLPPDINRVVIRPIRALEGSDYINASWIDGFRSRKAYIATQSPLKETIEDFWRMLWEHDCGIVVSLNEMQQSSQFWPNTRSARYQFFVVDPVAEYQMSHFVLREFKLTDARDGQTRVLRLFQFVDWIDDTSLPISTENFLELILQVHKTREQFGHKGPITVHCGSGSCRTGIFLALSILLDKLKDEVSFNIFEIFKLLKWQRPSLVESEDQYQFCFAALLEYLTLYSDETTHC